MDISKATHEKMIDMLNLFLSNPTYELEGKFKGDVTKDAFTRCIQYCKQQKFVEEIHQETMDVVTRMDGLTYRVTIIGKDNIATVFKTNNLPASSVQMMRKTVVNGVKPIIVDDLSFKVDLKDEKPLDEKLETEISLKFPSLDKGFRFKKRFSYLDKKEGLRYDFTIVRTSRYVATDFVAHKTMAQSGVLNAKEAYELEIELLREVAKKEKDDEKRTKQSIIKGLVSSMISINLRVNDEKFWVSANDKMEILKGYIKLCYGRDGNISDVLKKISLRPKEFFVGPQPVTLERKNILEPGLGIVSIKKDYTVTEKADGERYLLYVDNEGKCFLINNRLSIKYTGVKLNRITNSVFDGELITADTLGRKAMMFGIFDVYYYNGSDLRMLPLVSDGKSGYEAIDNSDRCRYNTMKVFANQSATAFNSQNITLFAKEFKYDVDGKDILEVSKELMEKANGGGYAYKIDGLIYTPKYYAVGGQFLKDVPSNGRTWEMVFKWKPPHDNTIDFLVRYDKDNNGNLYVIPKDNKMYKSVTLFVGYNPSIHDRLTAKKFLTNDIKQVKSYVPKEFIPDDVVDASIANAFLLLDETKDIPINKVVPRCLSGDAIEDNSIVEFAYDATKGPSYSQHWVPLRVRHDKTDMLRRFGLSGTANDYKTALNVWSSIQHPVEEAMVTGEKVVTKDDIIDDDIYFSSNLDRYKYASLIMKNFHNEYIKKRELIMKMPKGASLFDIACGKAGDLKKWIDAGFTKVMGIDVVRDNIENRKNGAYARTLEALQKFNLGAPHKKHQYVYLTADASQRFTPQYVEAMSDPDDKQVARILFGMQRTNQVRDENLSKYVGYMKGGFDVISCQFAIHYFFENEMALDNFIYNVDNYLKPGGYLIGTCLDGYRVKEKLSSIKKGESIQGQIDDRILWNIKKLYANNGDIKLGEQIEIYMESIGKPIKEYLVDFNLLRNKLAEKGIDVLTPEECADFKIEKSVDSFKYSYNKVVASSDNSLLARDIRVMTEQEKEYSFLNSWFIFKKH